jgi:integrase
MALAYSITKRGKNSYRIAVKRAGQQHTKTVRADKARDVEQAAIAFVSEIERGHAPAAPARLTFEGYLGQWLDAIDVRPLTLRNYKNICKVHIIPALGAIPLRALKPIAIKTAFTGWKKSLAPSSLKTVEIVLKSALTYAEKFDMIPISPMRKLKGDLPGRAAPEAAIVPQGRIAELMNDPVYGLAIELAAVGGMRRGEICGLEWRDVDFTKGTVRVERQFLPTGDYGPPKSESGVRTIRLPETTMQRLRAERKSLAERLIEIGIRKLPIAEMAVFNDIGLPRKPDSLSHWCNRQGIKFHNLRHSHISLLLSGGANIASVSKRAGHSSVATTLNAYAHVLGHEDDQAAAIMGKVFNSN